MVGNLKLASKQATGLLKPFLIWNKNTNTFLTDTEDLHGVVPFIIYNT